MNLYKKLCLSIMILVLAGVGIISSFTVGIADVQVFTHIEAKGTSFNPGDSFSVYVVPVNRNSSYLSNLKVNLSLPENIIITDTILPDKPNQLDPYEAKVFEYVVRNASPLHVSLPKTGDRGLPPVLWFVLCGTAILLIWKIGFKRSVSFFLVFCFCIQLVPSAVIAEDSSNKLLIGERGKLTLQGDGKNFTLSASATATEDNDLAKVDADSDGLSLLDEALYGSDDNKKDTDGDGLSDYQEVNMFFTDPTKADTDGDGTPDGQEDADKDGLNNLDEFSRGTNPLNDDTDGDGLKDGKEIEIETNPLKADTDDDGMLDGFEVDHHFDPKNAELSVEISDQYDNASSSVTAQIVVRNVTGAQAQSLSINEIPSDDILLGSHVPGWIGNACEINMDNSSGGLDATLTMTYDKSLIGSDFQPEICYFDEENQTLDPLPNQTDDKTNGKVSAPISHFSDYIMVNAAARVIAAVSGTSQVSIPTPSNNTGLILVEDSDFRVSAEVTDLISNTWYFLFNHFPHTTSIYGNGDNKFTRIIDPGTEYKPYSKRASSSTVPSGVAWTDWYTPAAFLEYLLEFGDYTKYNNNAIYFVTSTVDQLTVAQAEAIANKANNKKTQIHLIIVDKDQDYNDSTLDGVKKVTSLTNGGYYIVNSLDNLYGNTSGIHEPYHPGYYEDRNNDGINDGYTWDIINGTIKSDIYGNVFNGISYESVQASADFDHDGRINGNEISIRTKNGKKYVYVTSLPTLKDSDFDGIPDSTEPGSALSNNHPVIWKEGMLSKGVNAILTMDYRWFEKSPSEFNRQLATTSLLVAATAYDQPDSTLNGNTRIKAFSELLGLDNVVSKQISGYGIHNAKATMGYHEFEDQGKHNLVILVAVTGYYDNGWEWVSNFTVGDPNESYLWTKKEDNQYDPLWAKKESDKSKNRDPLKIDDSVKLWNNNANHLGFDIAANLLTYALADYLNAWKLKDALQRADKICIWTTGHSRGGAVSNILAANIIDRRNTELNKVLPSNKCKVFAYDFATPRTTQSSEYRASRYNCIFNVVNDLDVVPMLPLQDWKFNPYGRVYHFNLNKVTSKKADSNKAYQQFLERNLYDNSKGLLAANIKGVATYSHPQKYPSPQYAFLGITTWIQNILPASEPPIELFKEFFYSLSNNRNNLYKPKIIVSTSSYSGGMLTLGTQTADIIERAIIDEFISYEEGREKQYTTPGTKPSQARNYYGVSDNGKKRQLWITPEYTMTLFGRAVADIFGHNLGGVFEFYLRSALGLSYKRALAGAINMVIGSGVLSTHVDAAYYLGSFFAEEK